MTHLAVQPQGEIDPSGMPAGEDPGPRPVTLGDVATLLREISGKLNASDPEGLSFAEAAEFLGISVAKLRELDSGGQCPSPARLGTGCCPRFSRSVLRAWLISGAPSRAKWMQMESTALRRAG